MNAPLQVAASQQRNRIPTEWLLEFAGWTDESLISLVKDSRVTNREIKAYATWELDFRNAFGLEIEAYEPDEKERLKHVSQIMAHHSV